MRYMLATYASSNDGRFPARLDHLAWFEDDYKVEKFRDFRSGRLADWEYFPGFVIDDRGDTILVAAPFAFSKADGTFRAKDEPSRIILTLDGRMLIVAEKTYQDFIVAQSSGDWRASPRESERDPWRFLDAPIWRQADPQPAPIHPAVPAADIPMLIDRLESGGDTIRWNAADALAEMEDPPPEVVAALLRALGDSEAGYLSAMGLARISLHDASVIPPIVDSMRSGETKAEYWAAVALCEIGLDRAPEALLLMVEALQRHGDDIQITAAKALAGLGPQAAVAVPNLVGVLSDGDSWAVKCAVIALGRIGPKARAAIPALRKRFDSGADYQMDAARALFLIEPGMSTELVPFLKDVVAGQRKATGSNEPMSGRFFQAIELLGQMGVAAEDAIPVLKDQLRGGARTRAAWSLWRIDPMLLEPMTEIITKALDDESPPEDRFAETALRSERRIGFYSGLEALGMLWQMHPGRRAELQPVLARLLRAWYPEKGLDRFNGSARCAIPALEDLLREPIADDLRKIAGEALQEIRATDPGNW